MLLSVEIVYLRCAWRYEIVDQSGNVYACGWEETPDDARHAGSRWLEDHGPTKSATPMPTLWEILDNSWPVNIHGRTAFMSGLSYEVWEMPVRVDRLQPSYHCWACWPHITVREELEAAGMSLQRDIREQAAYSPSGNLCPIGHFRLLVFDSLHFQ